MPEPLISLCMIVGNVEEYIERCLKSFLPIADEICLVRAIGNSVQDKTIEIAEKTTVGLSVKSVVKFSWSEYRNEQPTNPDWQQWKRPGVKSQSWPHLDDFAAARNQAFNMATGKYIFWADSDDVLEHGAEAIRQDAEEGKWTVYIIPYRIFGRDVNIQRERMMRRGSGKWLYPVHECYSFDPIVEGALDERASVIHLPKVSKTGSNDRNLKILEAIPEDKLTPGLKYHLHGELLGTGQIDRALKTGIEAAKSQELGVPERYEIFLNLGKLAKTKDLSIQLFHEAYKLDPTRRESLGLLCCTAMDHGMGKEAMGYARAMMSLPPPEKPNWNDRTSAYDWLGVDIYAQAARYHGFQHSREGNTAAAQKYLRDANKQRASVLKMAIKSGRPIISLIHATRGRPIMASKARKMWLDLADRPDAIEHIFVYAEDDEKSYPLSRMHHIMIPPGLGCVGAWNAGAQACYGEILIQMSDDWIPPLQWDTQIIERLKAASIAIQNQNNLPVPVLADADKTRSCDASALVAPTVESKADRGGEARESTKPIGNIRSDSRGGQSFSFEPLVLSISDGHRTDNLLCMAIMTRRYYDQDNFMFHPRFFGVYSDNWFTHEAYRRNQVVEAKDLVFTHNHPFFAQDNCRAGAPPADLDETYQIQNDPKRYAEGMAIYNELLNGRDWSTVPGWFNYWTLYQVVAKTLKDGDVAAEVGVYLGRSIIYLAQECKRLGKKVKLLAIDNFQGEPGVKEHADTIADLASRGTSLKDEFLKNAYRCGVSDMITLMEGDSIKVARDMPNEHLAFCFIDASHDYDSVRKDITAWVPKMKKNHCISGHDAQWEGVKKAVLERFPNAYINGPVWMARPE